MRKHFLLAGFSLISLLPAKATVHTIGVWDGYFQFVPDELTIQLGDTIQWLPYFAPPTMLHTITSTNIPAGATAFDETFQPPADTFYQYVPQVVGIYDYKCTPHSSGPFNMVGSFTVTTSLSAAENIAGEFFSIGTNPVADFITLPEAAANQAYQLIASNGKEIRSGVTASFIDIREIPAGLYFLTLQGDRPKRTRFIKQ
jgi:plastocyanin